MLAYPVVGKAGTSKQKQHAKTASVYTAVQVDNGCVHNNVYRIDC